MSIRIVMMTRIVMMRRIVMVTRIVMMMKLTMQQSRRLVTARQRQELYSLNLLMTRLEKEAFTKVTGRIFQKTI